MLDLATTDYVLIAIGGLIAGAMNTLAGYGSIITLSILMDIVGLPGTIANATNRVNILTNGLGAILGFKKGKKNNLSHGKYIILATILGAILGIITATQISNESFRFIFKYLIVVLLILVVVNPRRWLREDTEYGKLPIWMQFIIFMPIGFYGGFIQMGMGIFFIAAMVLLAHYNLIESNALKVTIVTLYTAISLAIFHYHGMVQWSVGGLLGTSTFIGGYAAASISVKYKNATLWAYRVLILIVIIVVIKTWIL